MADTSRWWPAPAKLNLFLHITGRRSDGYHLLQTLFQLLDYGDRLRFTPRDDGRIVRAGELEGVPAAQDLCVRAAQRLQAEAAVTEGVTIELDKRLPLGGGLGGGSSDAATTLIALNALWGLDWPVPRLAELGLALGADVPVFVHGRSAWAEGVGELLEPVELPSQWYLVLHPGSHVSTASVFARPELTRHTPRIKMAAFRAGQARNDCEPVVRALYPEVDQALNWLSGYGAARLTGTGACIFAAFPGETAAREVLAQVPRHWQAFVARGVNTSPLRLEID